MPVACVDLLVADADGRVLLLLRRNHPARGQWWFPGGRVFHLETRQQAVRRTLQEECGLQASRAEDLGTFDVILEHPEHGAPHHGITTLFALRIDGAPSITVDAQSSAHAWRSLEGWRQEPLHEFVRMGLSLLPEKLR